MQSQQIWRQIENLENESQIFREECEATLAMSMTLGDRNQYLREELMVLMEESVAEKSKTLKVLELALSGSKSEHESFAVFVNIREETAIILEMLEEVKKDFIYSDNANIRFLHTNLLRLPFLPESHRSRAVESAA